MKHYTIGEIYRLKLLLNHKGEPYTAKATISKIVQRLKYAEKQTAFGKAKMVSEREIQKWNERW